MPNTLEEYLVKLGGAVDQSGMQKFHQALREATSVADSSTKAIAFSFAKAQAEIVGGFAAIGTAAVGLVDKVAMADQSYRLFGLHMMMGKEQARGLKVAMDALGESLEDMTWDKELRDRTHQLIMDQRAMAPGGDFEAQLKKVRDIRFEFTRMEVEGQYLAMHVVQNFLQALGYGPDELLNKLRKFNDWVIHDLPGIASKVATLFMPVWNDLKMVGGATAKVFMEAGVAFSNIIGLLTGDDSITGTTFDLEKMAKAVEHIVHGFAVFATAIANVEESLLHLISSLALLAHGHFGDAAKEIGAAFDSVAHAKTIGLGAGAATGVLGGALAGAEGGAALGSLLGPVGTALGGTIGGVLGGGSAALAGGFIGSNIAERVSGGGSKSGGDAGIGALIDRYAAKYGVSAALAHALAAQESGERQTDRSGAIITSSTGAMGAMQLTRGTAKLLGVDRTNADQNVEGGVRLLAQLLQHYHGDVGDAIGAYHEGQGKMDRILAGRATMSPEGRDEVLKVLRRADANSKSLQVGTIVVNVTKPGATNEDVGNALVAKLQSMQNKRVQRNLAELQDSSYS
jgi:hypothetical protein